MSCKVLWYRRRLRGRPAPLGAGAVAAAFFVAAAGCSGPAGGGRAAEFGPSGRAYLVVADNTQAATCGMYILGAGGNAADAAVAVSFALAVVRPDVCGLGGGGCALYCAPGQSVTAFDFREQAPAAARSSDYLDREGAPIPGRASIGPWAAAVPGQVRGALDLWRRFGSGRLTLDEILAPAILLAQDGFTVDRRLHQALAGLAERYRAYPDYRQRFAETYRTLLRPGGIAYMEGDILKRPDLGSTLAAIAKNGADAFYRGTVGEAIVREIGRLGGVLSAADMSEYRVRATEPLAAELFGCRLYAAPPPSAGGAIVLQAMGVLAAAGERGGSSFRAHFMAEAMKHAFAEKALLAAESEQASAARRMISRERIEQVLGRIDPEHVSAAPVVRLDEGALAMRSDGAETAHFCVWDADGGVASWSESIGRPFGSLVSVPGTGVLLNGAMADFPLHAGGGSAGADPWLRPGARPLTCMAPVIVLGGDGVRLVAGAAGGSRAASAVLAVLEQVLAENAPLGDAVRRGRFHHQFAPDVLLVEPSVRAEVLQGLLARGHTLRAYRGDEAGRVQAIEARGGMLRGAVDARGE